MHCTRLGLLGALAFLPAFAQVSNVSLSPNMMGSQDTVGSQDTTEQLAPRQFGPIRDNTEHGDGTASSTNWSGFAVLGSGFTWAKGSWVVPTAKCTGVERYQYAAFWVGLDGYSSTTVEQTGTDSDCDLTAPTYYAWYEFYPAASFTIPSVPVKPGDIMSAVVKYDSSNDEFVITITNETTGKTFSKSKAVAGAVRSSAEWITEAPCCTNSGGILPLSDFGTVSFGEDSTSVADTNYAIDTATTGRIGKFPAVDRERIDKVASSTSPQTSTCSALSADGTSFTCTWAK
jgi:hypothetical protein